MNNYVCYHLHSDYSLLDSCTKFQDYVYRAKELGQKAICFTEHGNIYHWMDKKVFCEGTQYRVTDENGTRYFPNEKKMEVYVADHPDAEVKELPPIHYLHGVEAYLTQNEVGDEEKIRDNFHTILIAKNEAGFKELNLLVDLASRKDHRYFKPRITFSEFLNISNNIIKISACLASPLRQYHGDRLGDLIRHYDYLEIQPHVNSKEQKEYNKQLVTWSKQYGIPLIAGTDTHSISPYKAECRKMLMIRKGITFSGEDGFDLTYKSYDELVQMFQEQDVVAEEDYLEAIENTNRMADSVFTFELDKSYKYPQYDDVEREFKDAVNKGYKEKLACGAITANPRYKEQAKEEFRVFKKLGMLGFMKFMSELVNWAWEHDIPVGFGRGSVCGSLSAYLMGITDVNPMKWDTIFSRFANENRISLGDIDVDFAPKDRALVYQYIKNRFGLENTAYVLTIGTIAEKGCIDDIAGALNSIRDDDKYSLAQAKLIKDLYEKEPEKAREQYPELFYYFDGMLGTNVSHGIHAAGIIVSPVTLPDNYGTFWDSEDHRVICLGMDECHNVNLVKYDVLGLNTTGILNDTFKMAGLKYPKAHEINWEDKGVWDHIADYPIGIFQFESSFAFDSLKSYGPRSISDLTLINASIRPSGASYRDAVFAHQTHHNPSKIIDDMLKESLGFLVYQEQVTQFLQEICGLSGGDADNVRRAIASKKMDVLQEWMTTILDGYCSRSDQPREIAEKEAQEFLQVVIDASSYMFGFNHATAYSMISYLTAYCRYNYPVEFCTAYLNNPQQPEDIINGTKLANDMGIKIKSIQFRHSQGEYSCDAESRTIYKGLDSIKYLSSQVADDLYALRDTHFDSFIDLLVALKDTSINSRQLQILTQLDFFSEFGRPNELLAQIQAFDLLYGRKSMRVDAIQAGKYGVGEYLVAKYAGKHTAKTYSDLDSMGLLKEYVSTMDYPKTTLYDRLTYELDGLGYCTSKDPHYKSDVYFVTGIDGKFKKKYVTYYRVADGTTTSYKTEINGDLMVGSVVRLDEITEKFKYRKTGEDPATHRPIFEKTEETEPVVTSFYILRRSA